MTTGVSRHVHGPRSSVQLTRKTWSLFDRFFAANGGVWGGCWCTFYQVTGTFDSNAYQRNRRKKRELVGAGTAHGTIAMCGDEPVAWCQFGPREELPRIDTRRGYAPTARGAWRVTCFYVDRRHRRQGFGRYSLLESMEEMKRLGVRAVEAYPVEGRRSATLLWSGTPELFEGAGFSRVGHLGKNSWVYSIELPKRARRQR